MAWNLSNDVEDYADRTRAMLSDDPVEHTLPLTVMESVRSGRRWSDEEMVFGWYERDGLVRGAVSMTPPFHMLLAAVPDDSIAGLVSALRDRGVTLPGVHGAVSTVERFVAAWTAGTALGATTAMNMRLYVLEALRPPTPAPDGRARAADAHDLDVVTRWIHAFHEYINEPPTDSAAMVRASIDQERLWLWHDEAGAPVAMAARSTIVAGVSRVGPVYTPSQHRRRGYGSAVTAACTADALRRGARHAVLFTDLANATSNSIYQHIGYRPVSDRRAVRFQADRVPAGGR